MQKAAQAHTYLLNKRSFFPSEVVAWPLGQSISRVHCRCQGSLATSTSQLNGTPTEPAEAVDGAGRSPLGANYTWGY